VRIARGERGIWQRRFWEHAIRDDADYAVHVDYGHINPVKQGFVQRAVEWPYSTFHRWNRIFIHWMGLADPTSMFREAKEVDSQTSHAAQYASTLLRPTRATRAVTLMMAEQKKCGSGRARAQKPLSGGLF
jgi:hypothetical protein